MDDKTQLVQLLEDELVLHKEMVPLLEEEKGCLIAKKTAELLVLLKKKEAVVEKIQEKEHQRKALVMALSAELKMSSDKITLSFLSGYWRDPQLLKLKKRLSDIIEEIQTKQQLNNALVRNAQDLIREAVAVMYAQQQPDAVYSPQGVFNDRAKEQGYLDKNI